MEAADVAVRRLHGGRRRLQVVSRRLPREETEAAGRHRGLTHRVKAAAAATDEGQDAGPRRLRPAPPDLARVLGALSVSGGVIGLVALLLPLPAATDRTAMTCSPSAWAGSASSC